MSQNWTEVFQWFHAHPELGFQERRTTKKIREILTAEGVPIAETKLETGLIAVIRGAEPGPSVCLRADIDALPITERTDLPYRSQNAGVMHACGHDFHITAALAAVEKLYAIRDRICGTIYAVFQPAEELFGGTELVQGTGVLDEVGEFYGFHAEPNLPAGVVGISAGGVMAAVDAFRVDIQGVGAHGAMPHLGKNPILAMAELIQALRAFSDREVSAFHPHVISVTHVSGGSTWNVIPEAAYFEGTVRTLDPEDRDKLRSGFQHILCGVGEITGTSCVLDWKEGPPAVWNDERLCGLARRAAEEGGFSWTTAVPAMTGDDFSCYTAGRPETAGLYLKIGTGVGPALHNPKFQVDPAAIPVAADYLTALLSVRLT